MLIGLDIYVCYGIKHSKLEHMQKHRSGQTTLDMIGITLSVLCVITGLWHQQTVGWGEQSLIDYLIRIRFYASSFLSLQTREAVYEPYPLAIQHDYVSMAHATSPDGQRH